MRFDMGRTTIKRGPGQRLLDGKSFVSSMRCATFSVGQPVTMSASSPSVSWVLFSTETGDACLLDPSDQLAARLARDGEPEPIHIEEMDTTFAIGWKGQYRIERLAFVYADRDSSRVTTTLGYPTHELNQMIAEISNMFG